MSTSTESASFGIDNLPADRLAFLEAGLASLYAAGIEEDDPTIIGVQEKIAECKSELESPAARIWAALEELGDSAESVIAEYLASQGKKIVPIEPPSVSIHAPTFIPSVEALAKEIDLIRAQGGDWRPTALKLIQDWNQNHRSVCENCGMSLPVSLQERGLQIETHELPMNPIQYTCGVAVRPTPKHIRIGPHYPTNVTMWAETSFPPDFFPIIPPSVCSSSGDIMSPPAIHPMFSPMMHSMIPPGRIPPFPSLPPSTFRM